jgi:hypothetical protein
MASLGILNTQLESWKVPVEPVAPLLADAYEQGCLFTEHTWGIHGPAFGTPDHATWKKELAEGKYKDQLATFKWHAAYAYEAERITRGGIAPRMESLAGRSAQPDRGQLSSTPCPGRATA